MPELNPDVATVKKKYPPAFSILSITGRWEILVPSSDGEGYDILGYGASAADAWKDAVRNLE